MGPGSWWRVHGLRLPRKGRSGRCHKHMAGADGRRRAEQGRAEGIRGVRAAGAYEQAEEGLAAEKKRVR